MGRRRRGKGQRFERKKERSAENDSESRPAFNPAEERVSAKGGGLSAQLLLTLLLLRGVHGGLLLLLIILLQEMRRDLLLVLMRRHRSSSVQLRWRRAAVPSPAVLRDRDRRGCHLRRRLLLLLLLRRLLLLRLVLRLLLGRNGGGRGGSSSGRLRSGSGGDLPLLRGLHAVSADTCRSLTLGGGRLRVLALLLGPGRDVQGPVNDGRDRLDLGAEFLLDPVEVVPVIGRDQVDRETEVTVTARTTDPVQVRLGRFRKIKVDDDVDGLDVDTAGEQVGADEVAADAVAEVVEDAVAVRLEHARVRVEARVAEFGNLLGEELDPVRRVAEDDRLVDLELEAGAKRGGVNRERVERKQTPQKIAPWRRGC